MNSTSTSPLSVFSTQLVGGSFSYPTLMAGFLKLSYTHYVEAPGSQTAFTLSVLLCILVAALIISLYAEKRILEVGTSTHVGEEYEARNIPEHTERGIELSEIHSQGDCPTETSAAAEDSRVEGNGHEPEQSQTYSQDQVDDPDLGNGHEPEQSPTHSEGQVVDLKIELKVVCFLVPIPTGGIISVLAGLPGNENAVLIHKALFKAYTVLLFSSFLSCVVVFMLIFIRPKMRGLKKVVRIVMWMSLVLVTYAMALAICILLPMSLMGLLLVLVSPVVLVSLAMVFYIMNKNKCN